ncbi:Chitinase 1 [Tulasnella sp. 418]|nr:Chitinase 1 [Tulasnella sp. 418]
MPSLGLSPHSIGSSAFSLPLVAGIFGRQAATGAGSVFEFQHRLNRCQREGLDPSLCNTVVPLPDGQAYDNTCNSNLVTFWGQNSYGATHPNSPNDYQKNIGFYCDYDSINVIPVAFMDSFFGPGGLPTINLANICGGNVFPGTGLAQCQFLAADIKKCQAKGKIVTLSLGGASATSFFSTQAQAVQLADNVWNLFLGGNSATRPFGDAVLDGVDLDIEHAAPDFSPFVNRLRSYFSGAGKKYYVTAAPQCVFPDPSMSATLANSYLDAIYVQFYNNWCGLQNFNDLAAWNFGVWDYWARNVAPNKGVKIYIGAPASDTAAGSGYVNVATLGNIIQQTRTSFPSFGGVMLWDASQAYKNNRYDSSVKALLKAGGSCGAKSFVWTPCTAPTWSASGSYPGGTKVTYQGYEWVARWWADGPPDGLNDSGVWRAQRACKAA